ncbi:MAG: cell wall hydrolase [Lachnospiraceae bacterium]|nr:cell wall hydrolase [Lachnospiraceae bacterium]
MYKRALGCVVMLQIIFLCGMFCVHAISYDERLDVPLREVKLDARLAATEQESAMGIMDTSVSGQRVVQVSRVENKQTVSCSADDKELLLRIVEAEAGNQDADGRLLVANVVLNRVASETFPDTVEGVVLQESGGAYQFSPVANGRLWRVQISEETRDAVDRALDGEDISEGALYFVARQYADAGKVGWFDRHLTYLFEWGGHEFFK